LVGTPPRDRDQTHALIDHAPQCLRIEHAVRIVGDDLDDGTGPTRGLEEGDVIRRILGPGGQDAVAGAEGGG
jgi:hypothetical protein